jgi:hypothetical protein
MEAVKEYWQNKIFIFGFILCAIGTLAGAFGAASAGVFIEACGICFMLVAIYQVTSKEDSPH